MSLTQKSSLARQSERVKRHDLPLDPSVERDERLHEPVRTPDKPAARARVVSVARERGHLFPYHLGDVSGYSICDLDRDVHYRVTRFELFVERRRQGDPSLAPLRIEPADALRRFLPLAVPLLELDHRCAAVEQGVTHGWRVDLQLDRHIVEHAAPPVSATTTLCQQKPGVQRTRTRWRPACDRELVPHSGAQSQAQPMAARVGSLCARC